MSSLLSQHCYSLPIYPSALPPAKRQRRARALSFSTDLYNLRTVYAHGIPTRKFPSRLFIKIKTPKSILNANDPSIRIFTLTQITNNTQPRTYRYMGSKKVSGHYQLSIKPYKNPSTKLDFFIKFKRRKRTIIL